MKDERIRYLSSLALRFLGGNADDESQWQGAFEKALRFEQIALEAAAKPESPSAKRQGPDYVPIAKLVKDERVGGVTDEKSLIGNRIARRIPRKHEIKKLRKHLEALQRPLYDLSLKDLVKAMEEVKLHEHKQPAAVLCLFGWLDNLDVILAGKNPTLEWGATDDAEDWTLEKAIIQPTQPPTFEDLDYYISSAMDEYHHKHCPH
ncbi:hypothetical protein Rhal01_00235 [Rubritalea halochordaticola]|uniref:Uncharacterized protein n=1 Tax=Rubritalea halochordaticola TaxID=714537 RepID=A0ABP9UWP0_9BACT